VIIKEILAVNAGNGNPGGARHRADVKPAPGLAFVKKSLSTQSVIDHFVSPWH
jgi:hypothetical protein